MSDSASPRVAPGPLERRLRSRIIFKLTGRWPDAVVQERLLTFERRKLEVLAEMMGSLR